MIGILIKLTLMIFIPSFSSHLDPWMIPGHRSRSKELEEFLNFVKGYEARQDNFYKSPLAENRWKRARKQWRRQKWELQQQKIGTWPIKMMKNSGIVRCWYIISYPAVGSDGSSMTMLAYGHMDPYGGIKMYKATVHYI